ncbi:MAG: hypothetical protein U1A05_02810 [Alphaproteobacteria bacterium]|nr:hypothetical protein [Alphaproteobacteria bacterium]
MNKNSLSLIALSLFLSGCTIGSMISGHTGHLSDDYPDIRSVPSRQAATQSRDVHEGDEKEASAADFKKLEQDRTDLQVRNESLRENAFPKSE